MSKKKSIGKISALLLCMVLIMCMLPMTALAHTTSGPVFDGTTSGSLTINKTDGAGTPIADTTLAYTVYKVADITQTNVSGVVSVQYILGNGITLTGGVTGNGTTVTVPTGTTASDFISGLPTGTTVTNSGSGTLTFSGLPLGLYLVRETTTPAGVAQSNDFLVSIPMSKTVSGNSVWDYDPVASPKNTVVDGMVSKGIASGATLESGSTYTASLGNKITYSISATLPTTFTITPYTTYKVTDIPSAGLVIDMSSIAVSVGGTALPSADYTVTANGTGFDVELIKSAPTGTTTTAGTNFSSSLTNGAVVTITYDATLSPTATATSFTNDVEVNYAYNTAGGGTIVTDPSDPGKPNPITPDPLTPSPTIKTYNYALQKVDGDNSNAPLAGAKFAIKNSGGNYMAWTSTNGWTAATGLSDPNLYTFTSAGPNAIVPFNGLAGGSYSLEEIAAPSGYSALTAPIAITIDAASTADADTGSGGAGYSIQVVNTLANVFTLPGTGGMGIYLYTIGGVLLIGAAIVLFTKNRKKKGANA